MSYTVNGTRFTMFETYELKELLIVIQAQDLDNRRTDTLEKLRQEITLELSCRSSQP